MPFGRGRPHYHYGLFAGAVRAQNTERVRQLLTPRREAAPQHLCEADSQAEEVSPARRCPCWRRADDHRRNFRSWARPAPSARRLQSRIRIDTSLTVAKHPLLAAPFRLFCPDRAPGSREQRWPRQFAGPPPTRANAPDPRIFPTEHARRRRLARRTWLPTPAHATNASALQASIPIARTRLTSPQPPRGFLPGRLSNAGPHRARPSAKGPASETLHVNPSPFEASTAAVCYVRNTSIPVIRWLATNFRSGSNLSLRYNATCQI